MAWYESGGILVGLILFFMAIGVPVAVAFIAANLIGIMVFAGGLDGLTQIINNSTNLITNYTFSPVPLFMFMGGLFFHTGLAIKVFDGLDKLMGRLPGRLCYLTIAGGTMFSTLTGSTMANTAMLGSLLVPEMRRRGYSTKMTIGPILGTGGLAMIIPPSTLGVLLASLAGIDVGRLLVAGALPGLVLATLYASMVFLQVKLDPDSAPSYEVERVPMLAKLAAFLIHVAPMALVIFMVIGFIILGLATPTESAAFGVAGVLILALLYGRLTWEAVQKALQDTVKVSGMVFFIVMGSAVFSQLLAFSGASSGMLRWATHYEVGPLVILLAIFCVYLLLGMFMDQVSMMLITVPIVFPLAQGLGFDLIWFAMIVMIALEMSLTTPPFGLLLFIMLGVAPKGTTMGQVIRAALPFLFCDGLLVVLMVAFPPLVLYLPSLMG